MLLHTTDFGLWLSGPMQLSSLPKGPTDHPMNSTPWVWLSWGCWSEWPCPLRMTSFACKSHLSQATPRPLPVRCRAAPYTSLCPRPFFSAPVLTSPLSRSSNSIQDCFWARCLSPPWDVLFEGTDLLWVLFKPSGPALGLAQSKSSKGA